MQALPTEDELKVAKGRVKEAISLYRAAGKDIALAEFMNPGGRFVRGDHYIFAVDINGVMLAHPINQRFAGLYFLDCRDSEGKGFVREIVENAARNSSGFAQYRWYRPGSKKDLPKTTYYERSIAP